ncbi:MAG: N-acetylmuramoyl-L-alanine amidase [Cyclobacteriaceae bacterium]|nr:N-acetylmuramoyl-L-alanine amidase [Cyclobacteriaceae bacterium]
MNIIDHQLEGTGVKFIQTPNFYNPPFNTPTGLPDAVIIHYTAMTSAEGAVKVLTVKHPDGNNASAHLVIGKKGEVFQLAKFNQRTWHAGESSFNGRKGYNSLSIGIEIDNVGWLTRQSNGKFSRTRLNAEYTEDQVVHQRHSNPKVPYEYWEKYTQEQIDVVFDICELLRHHYGIIEILGHDQIAPDRKQDPGPAFPMDELRSEVIKDRSGEAAEGRVNTNLLNIRAGAGPDFEKVAQPLNINSDVEILEEKNGWYRVRTKIEGWVSKKYITPTK